jgi:hypothetical protein
MCASHSDLLEETCFTTHATRKNRCDSGPSSPLTNLLVSYMLSIRVMTVSHDHRPRCLPYPLRLPNDGCSIRFNHTYIAESIYDSPSKVFLSYLAPVDNVDEEPRSPERRHRRDSRLLYCTPRCLLDSLGLVCFFGTNVRGVFSLLRWQDLSLSCCMRSSGRVQFKCPAQIIRIFPPFDLCTQIGGRLVTVMQWPGRMVEFGCRGSERTTNLAGAPVLS